jgi:hypothetical protein
VLSCTAATLTWVGVDEPFGVTVDGAPPFGTLHFVGITDGADHPEYSVWNGTRWTASGILQSTGSSEFDLGLSAATQPKGGLLAVAWIAPGLAPSSYSLYFNTRSIPPVEVSAQSVLKPQLIITPTPTAQVSPTPQVTETPVASLAPQTESTPESGGININPIVLSGSLATVIVLFAFFIRNVFLKNNR